MEGRVGGHGGSGQQAWLTGSGGTAGQVGGLGGRGRGHGWPGEAGRAGRIGLGQAAHRRGGAVGAGRVGQERAGQGRFRCERTYEWFLEMCVPLKLARGTKLAAILDT